MKIDQPFIDSSVRYVSNGPAWSSLRPPSSKRSRIRKSELKRSKLLIKVRPKLNIVHSKYHFSTKAFYSFSPSVQRSIEPLKSIAQAARWVLRVLLSMHLLEKKMLRTELSWVPECVLNLLKTLSDSWNPQPHTCFLRLARLPISRGQESFTNSN